MLSNLSALGIQLSALRVAVGVTSRARSSHSQSCPGHDIDFVPARRCDSSDSSGPTGRCSPRPGRTAPSVRSSHRPPSQASANPHPPKAPRPGLEKRGPPGVAALFDTNVLIYRYDSRFSKKQRIATEILRRGIAEDAVRLPHQASSSRPWRPHSRACDPQTIRCLA